MQEYWVDAFCKIETGRLNWIRFNQPKLRVEKYKVVKEAAARQDQSAADLGKPCVLPSTFIGGPRHCQQLYQVQPTFAVFGCNVKYPRPLYIRLQTLSSQPLLSFIFICICAGCDGQGAEVRQTRSVYHHDLQPELAGNPGRPAAGSDGARPP